MKQKRIQIDRERLRAAVRKLGNEAVFDRSADALALLPPAKPHKVAMRHLDLPRFETLALARQTTKPQQRTALGEIKWA